VLSAIFQSFFRHDRIHPASGSSSIPPRYGNVLIPTAMCLGLLSIHEISYSILSFHTQLAGPSLINFLPKLSSPSNSLLPLKHTTIYISHHATPSSYSSSPIQSLPIQLPTTTAFIHLPFSHLPYPNLGLGLSAFIMNNTKGLKAPSSLLPRALRHEVFKNNTKPSRLSRSSASTSVSNSPPTFRKDKASSSKTSSSILILGRRTILRLLLVLLPSSLQLFHPQTDLQYINPPPSTHPPLPPSSIASRPHTSKTQTQTQRTIHRFLKAQPTIKMPAQTQIPKTVEVSAANGKSLSLSSFPLPYLLPLSLLPPEARYDRP